MHRWSHRGRIGRLVVVCCNYRISRSWGCYIHPTARLDRPIFPHPIGIVIGSGVVIESGVVIYQGVTIGARSIGETGYPLIRSDVTLYSGATVLGPVEIGRGAIVGAGSLVLSDVLAGQTVVGRPATPVR